MKDLMKDLEMSIIIQDANASYNTPFGIIYLN